MVVSEKGWFPAGVTGKPKTAEYPKSHCRVDLVSWLPGCCGPACSWSGPSCHQVSQGGTVTTCACVQLPCCFNLPKYITSSTRVTKQPQQRADTIFPADASAAQMQLCQDSCCCCWLACHPLLPAGRHFRAATEKRPCTSSSRISSTGSGSRSTSSGVQPVSIW